MSIIPTLKIAGKNVGRVGYGLMQLTWADQPPSQEVSFAAMKAAVDAGANCWSSATIYGPDNANVRLIAAFLKKYPEYKEKVVLVIKGCHDQGAWLPKGGDIDFVRRELKELKEILGDKKIDVYLPARLDPNASVEKVFQNMVTLQKEGHFTAIGAGEINAESLERAAKVAPISLVENELSLFTQDEPIRKVLDWSTKNQIPYFAYSPLGHGFLAGRWKSIEDLPENSRLKSFPWFQGEAFENNVKLVERLDVIAKKKGVTTSQLALAWITQLSPYTLPIPASTKPDRVRANTESVNIKFTPEELDEINTFVANNKAVGDRYPKHLLPFLMQ
nr:uncharacterized protein CI109_003843 [Kwoniella shandongensis]KAA5527871.1 hypothetical protein CI109_003843 [Kwoniella shandongensis]